ncbi:putative cytochrome 86B1-like [Capsicum annuum]|nr:putative cytochrome 86B1-like [Capsicum annuum]
MNVGPSGFNNAPVTRALVIACTLFTIIFGVRGRGNQLGWSYQDIFQKLQIWKLIISVFTFSSTPELIFGLYLLYYFRVFERQIGSNKYSVFLLFSFLVSLLLEVLALQLIKGMDISNHQIWNGYSTPIWPENGPFALFRPFANLDGPAHVAGPHSPAPQPVWEPQVDFQSKIRPGPGHNPRTAGYSTPIWPENSPTAPSTSPGHTPLLLRLPEAPDPSLSILSGPYGLIFSSFVPFYLDIPVSTRFRIFSLHFSDKSFIYLAGLQLLFSSWKRSIVPGLCGIIAGCLYRLNVFRIRRVKFPEFIASFFARLSWPSIGNIPPPSAPARNAPGNVPVFAGRQMEAIVEWRNVVWRSRLMHDCNSPWANYPAPVLSAPEPPEDAIAMLVSMGFDRSSARQALIHSRNDVNIATNVLLESQSH